jgi:hypothetical protein
MHKRTTEAEYYSKVLPSVTVRRCVIDARNRFANIHQQASKKFSAAAAARVLCPSTFLPSFYCPLSPIMHGNKKVKPRQKIIIV